MNSKKEAEGNTGKTPLNISLPAEDKKFLKVYAAQNGTTISKLVQDHIETLRGRGNGRVYAHIAQALARGYTDLYYVNIETGGLIEYHTDDAKGVLSEARRGTDFFEGCRRDAKRFVHPDDQEAFVNAMNRDFLTEALDKSKVFELTYRRIKARRIFYVRMKVSRVEEDPRFIVIAVSDIDEFMRQRREEDRIREERLVYARLHAISGNYICVYVVDPGSGRYREFSASDVYETRFAQEKEGKDFFAAVRKASHEFNHPDDLRRFLSAFTIGNVMAEIRRSGIYTLAYRLKVGDDYRHVQLKAAMVEENEGPRLIVGINDIDSQVRQEEEYNRRLEQAQSEANIDALTGVRNKHAYLTAEARLDRQISDGSHPLFAVVMLDVNDLKQINDTSGHQAGDQYLRDACTLICDTFKHSPVFRVGGDEFAVIAQGDDYVQVEERLKEIEEHNLVALRSGGIVVACGMSRFAGDSCVAPVFERADHKMYENKNYLKGLHVENGR
jgi:diguanylate cyclase (GGDEF)-like protein